MRLAWFVAFIAISLLSNPAVRAGAGTLDPANLRHEMKVTYCLEQRSKRIYRTENLEDTCTLKVAFFSEHVSKKNVASIESMLLLITSLEVLK